MLFSRNTYGLSLCSAAEVVASEAGFVVSQFSKDKVNLESHLKISLDSGNIELKKKNIIVSLSSSSIITVQADNQETLEAVSAFFPGVGEETFFTQRLGNTIALINKEELNRILFKCSENGIRISKLVLEPIVLEALQNTTGESTLKGLFCESLNGVIIPCETKQADHNLTVDDKNLSTHEYLAFGASLASEAFDIEESGQPERLSASSKSIHEDKTIKSLLIACVSLLLVLSVGNYLYYAHLTDLNRDLDAKLYSSNTSQERLDALKEKVIQHQQLRSGLNEVNEHQGAYLLDKLGSSLPKEIAFKKLSLESPQKIKEGYQIKFAEDELMLEGKTASTMALNNWIEVLTDLELVEDVKLVNYEDSKEKRGDFTLKLKLGV